MKSLTCPAFNLVLPFADALVVVCCDRRFIAVRRLSRPVILSTARINTRIAIEVFTRRRALLWPTGRYRERDDAHAGGVGGVATP